MCSFVAMKKRVLFSIIGLLLFSAAVHKTRLFEVTKNLEIFTALYKQIHLNYVEDVPAGELMKTATDAMLASLDPYTNFFTESQAEDALIQQRGDYGTPGMELTAVQGRFVVSRVVAGSSAEEQGVQLGDIVRSVNEMPVQDKNLSDLYKAFEGATGTEVRIAIERNSELLHFALIRRKPDPSNVPYFGQIEPGVGYIKLNQFMQNSATEVKTALVTLLQEHNIQSLVLDLRNNGGGLLFDAVRIVNLFVDRDIRIVYTQGKSEEHFTEYFTREDPIAPSLPLVVLINNNSASASEIVSGALQDLDRAVIIGDTSFGKGLVQNVLPLPYRHQLKVTVAKYYIPSGRCIQRIDYARKPSEQIQAQKQFSTTNGRSLVEVGGIVPDIRVVPKPNTPLVDALIARNRFFSFITSIQPPPQTNANEAPPQGLFDDFRAHSTQSGFSYESPQEKALQELVSTLDPENSRVQTLCNSLQQEIGLLKKEDWSESKTQITALLEREWVRKFRGEKAVFNNLFKHDPAIHASLNILGNPLEYNQLLKP